MKTLPWEYAVRNLGRSPVRLVLTVGSAALVVLLVLASAGFVRGMSRSLQSTGEPDNVMLLGAGSALRSNFPLAVRGNASTNVNDPGTM